MCPDVSNLVIYLVIQKSDVFNNSKIDQRQSGPIITAVNNLL